MILRCASKDVTQVKNETICDIGASESISSITTFIFHSGLAENEWQQALTLPIFDWFDPTPNYYLTFTPLDIGSRCLERPLAGCLTSLQLGHAKITKWDLLPASNRISSTMAHGLRWNGDAPCSPHRLHYRIELSWDLPRNPSGKPATSPKFQYYSVPLLYCFKFSARKIFDNDRRNGGCTADN